MGGYKEHKIFEMFERNSIILRYIIFIALVFIITMGLIGKIVNLNKGQENFIYTENSNIDYKVHLNENDFFDKNYLEAENQYIASLIKHVEANYEYKLDVSEKNLDYNYKYKLIAEVDVRDKTNQKSLYNYEENIFVSKENKYNSNKELVIEEKVNIDYNKYNELIKKFVGLYDLKNYEATVTLNMYVDIINDGNKVNKKETPVISLAIPLTTETMAINIETDSTIQNEINVANDQEIEKYTFGTIVFAILDIILIVNLVIFINDTKNEASVYKMRLRKIMSNYGSYIQKMTNEYNAEGRQIIEIKSFEDLLQIKETINMPILMQERENAMETFFLIATDKTMYIYELKAGTQRKRNIQ